MTFSDFGFPSGHTACVCIQSRDNLPSPGHERAAHMGVFCFFSATLMAGALPSVREDDHLLLSKWRLVEERCQRQALCHSVLALLTLADGRDVYFTAPTAAQESSLMSSWKLEALSFCGNECILRACVFSRTCQQPCSRRKGSERCCVL